MTNRQNGHKAKGFRFPVKTALLKFDGDFDGAEVRVRLNVPLQVYLDVQDAAANLTAARDGGAGGSLRELYGPFAAVIVDWNLEDGGGEPIPATAAGMLQVPPQFLALIIQAWGRASVEVPVPLPEPSGAGVP